MTIQQNNNQMQLEILAKDSGEPLQAVELLYDREYAALAKQARITNFIPLLALRRVRYQLLTGELIH